MKMVRGIFFLGLVVLYGYIFVIQEQRVVVRNNSLEFALPVTFHKIAAGYLKQLTAEMLFIKTSVFLGGLRPDTPPANYVDALGNNFEVMTSLYPRFIDPYYFCQAFLPPISLEAARKANTVLETGIAAYPNDFMLRLFRGSNFFLVMNEPLKGAQVFAEAANLPNAPPLFGHLAALLSARGGNIAAGLIALRTMLAAENDEGVRARYQEEIIIFEQAMAVNDALKAYIEKTGSAPVSLQQLVPDFISQLPETHDLFTLVYDPPNLHLKRPEKRKKQDTGIPFK